MNQKTVCSKKHLSIKVVCYFFVFYQNYLKWLIWQTYDIIILHILILWTMIGCNFFFLEWLIYKSSLVFTVYAYGVGIGKIYFIIDQQSVGIFDTSLNVFTAPFPSMHLK